MDGSLWTRKAGPLPMWGYGAILLGAALVWSFIQRGRSPKGGGGDSAPVDDSSTVPAEQVPDFISQTYVTVNGAPGPAGPAGPAGPPGTPPVNPPKTTLPGPVRPPTSPKPKPGKVTQYRVQHGDTLTSIAKSHGTTWQDLWTYNTTAGNRPADTIRTLKKRGPNRLVSGELILIPAK